MVYILPVCDNWLRIKLITDGANRKWFYLTVKVAVAQCRSEPYRFYDIAYVAVITWSHRCTLVY